MKKTKKQKQETILTTDQLAARWGLAIGTIANWRSFGKIPYHMTLSRHVYYKLSEIMEFEKENNVMILSAPNNN